MEYDAIYRANGNQRICAAVKDVSHSTKERKFVNYKMCGKSYIEWNRGQNAEPWGRCPGCSRRKIE